MNKLKLKVLSLFAGIGGFDKGLEDTGGFSTVAFCEIDKHAQKVLNKNWPSVPIFDDINCLSFRDGVLRYEDGFSFTDLKTDIDIVVGGFPCQDISVAGNKKGFEDEEGKRTRSGLWSEYKRLIEEIEPKYVIIENVRNLLNLGLSTVLKDLCDLGYDAEWSVISASSIGACHKRERVWIVAYPQSGRGRALYSRNSTEFRGGEADGEKIWTQDATEIERSSPGREINSYRVDDATFTKSERLQGLRASGEQEPSSFSTEGLFGGSSERNVTDSNLSRLWPAFTSEKEESEWWSETTACFRDWWEIEPTVCRVDDELPEQLDESECYF